MTKQPDHPETMPWADYKKVCDDWASQRDKLKHLYYALGKIKSELRTNFSEQELPSKTCDALCNILDNLQGDTMDEA